MRILPARGSFTGQVTQRQWTAQFRNADQPNVVQVDGQAVSASQVSYDAASRTLTVTVPNRSVRDATVVSYR